MVDKYVCITCNVMRHVRNDDLRDIKIEREGVGERRSRKIARIARNVFEGVNRRKRRVKQEGAWH